MDKVKINLGGTIVEMEREAVSSALEAGEITIETSNLLVLNKEDDPVVYTQEEFEKYTANTKKLAYDDGKVAGEEMPIKAARERHGLTFEGKTLEAFEEAFKKKVLADADKNPDKRVKELETDLTKLQATYSELDNNFTSYKSQITEKETRAKKDNVLLAKIPDNVIVDKDIALLALKTKQGIDVSFSEDNSKAFQTINGEVVKDKTQEPMTVTEEFITAQLKELNLLKNKKGGPGGEDDEGAGSSGDYAAFVKEMEANGENQGSEKFQLELNKRIANKTIKM